MSDRELPAWAQGDPSVLRAVVDTTPECIKIVAEDGTLLHMNGAGLAMVECGDVDAVQGGSIFDVIAPEHRDHWRKQHARVCGGERITWEFDIIGLRGTRRHMETHAVPLRLPDGKTVQLAITRDITARKKAEREQKLLIGELNHRVKNTLASVQSLIGLTARGASNIAQYRKALEARVLAMSVAHNLLSERHWANADIVDVVENCLAPYTAKGNVRLSGPAVALRPRMAIVLCMALNELATNAAKHGALSVSQGWAELNWTVADTGERLVLNLDWTERGGPPVEAVPTRGFGRELLERGLAAELGATVSLSFEASGLHCELAVPLTDDDPEAAT